VILTFGIARALPLLLLAIVARMRDAQLHEWLGRVSAMAALTLPWEIALLTLIGALFLVPGTP
jgi:hypothetical protein